MSEKYDATKEDPQLHALSQEHVKQCRACCQRTASHHLGVGQPLEDVQIQQQSEIATNILHKIDQLLDPKLSLRENKWFFTLGAIIVYSAQFLSNFIF